MRVFPVLVLVLAGCGSSATPPPEPLHPVERMEEEKRLQQKLEELATILREAATESGVKIVARSELRGETAAFTVVDQWHYQPYQMRLQGAQALQQGWARWAFPYEPKRARIVVLDAMGNKIGGSSDGDDGGAVWVSEK